MIKKVRFKILFVIVLTLSSHLFVSGQYNRALYDDELKLKIWFDSLFMRNDAVFILPDSKKIAYSDSIRQTLNKALRQPEAWKFPFDSLTNLGKIFSNDSSLRILTWNIRLKGGIYRYYGFIMKKNNERDIKVFELNDSTNTIPAKELENLTLSSNQWYGATYYQIIHFTKVKHPYYLLIGWKGYNAYLHQKIVEALWFNKKGKPIFGKAIFQSDQKTVKRLVFSHSIKGTMSCHYEPSQKAIIFDHLVPSSNIYQGMYEFYGPNGTFDAYFLKKNMWILKEDIEPKNPRKKNELPSNN
ncbi:MAG: hypothetical protein HPY79_09600 [Bacteroidales bacterium]|nr:hypothetical protein [Bacteroidales bacterium]